MILFSHPTGNENVRQALVALEESGLLARFWTTLGWGEGVGEWTRHLPSRFAGELQRRRYEAVPDHKMSRAGWREMGRLLAGRCGWGALIAHERGPFCVDRIYRGLDSRVAADLRRGRDPVRGVFCYEDGALETFREAERRGVRRIYELPIGYWRTGRAIQREEAEAQPEWAPTLVGASDSAAKLERKDAELARAELVLVASRFTEQSVAAAPSCPGVTCRVAYGCPAPVSESELGEGSGGPLRVLFVGGLSQRKGLSYLFDALDRVRGGAVLTLIGSFSGRCRVLEDALGRHRWLGALPRRDVLREMCTQDVLVFPSLFEGYGLVIGEALSRGLPVIATPHTAGPDILSEGEDGFVVPIRSAEAIAERLELLMRDRDRLREMRRAALRKAAARPWSVYRGDLVRAVNRVLSGERV